MRLLRTIKDTLSAGLFVLLVGITIMFMALGWSHIFFLALFSTHPVLYTGPWILFSIVTLGWIAEKA
jgi:hypothetical protein